MSTNNGDKDLCEEGDWKEWGNAYICESALMNIVSVSDAVKKGFRVHFDSDLENCFNVINKTNGRIIGFLHSEGLYVRDNKKTPTDYSMATSIEGFTQREIERARRARKFYHDLNAKSVENVKVFIRSNLARNIPVSSEDMDLAKKVFGKREMDQEKTTCC